MFHRRLSAVALALALVLAACGTSGPAAPRTPTVYGWWQAPDDKAAEDLAGGAVKLAPAEMIALLGNGELMIRPCTTTMAGATGTITSCGPTATLALDGDRLTLTDRGSFTMTRASAARAAELDAEVAAKRPPADACARAKTCYVDGMTALGHPPDADAIAFEFPPSVGPTDCQRTTKGIQMLLAEKSLAVPASCR